MLEKRLNETMRTCLPVGSVNTVPAILLFAFCFCVCVCVTSFILLKKNIIILFSFCFKQRPPSSSLSYSGPGNDDTRSPGSVGGTPGPLSAAPPLSQQSVDNVSEAGRHTTTIYTLNDAKPRTHQQLVPFLSFVSLAPLFPFFLFVCVWPIYTPPPLAAASRNEWRHIFLFLLFLMMAIIYFIFFDPALFRHIPRNLIE